MNLKSAIYNLVVLERHLDTLGHMNNATYLEIFEEARWDFITKNGYGMDRIQTEKKGPVILEINLKFQKELQLRENIRIETVMKEYAGKIGRLRQTILNQSTEVCCTMDLVFGLFDLKERKLIAPTQEWLAGVGISEV